MNKATRDAEIEAYLTRARTDAQAEGIAFAPVVLDALTRNESLTTALVR